MSVEAVDGDRFVTIRDFKEYVERKDMENMQYRLSIEKRLSRLETKQWIQIGMITLQILATVAVLMRVL